MKLPALCLAGLLAVAVFLEEGAALSYSVCDTIYEEYVTASPRLDGDWPYYNLLFTCTGNLNLEGFPVDACVLNGTKCGQAAADAFCQYLGFDHSSFGLYTSTQATSPALSMTGEWCASPGVYKDFGHPNRTQFESIVAGNSGPYCSSLSSVTCVKSRDSLRSGLAAIRANAASSPAVSPSQPPTRTADVLVNPSTVTAGRRMKAVPTS